MKGFTLIELMVSIAIFALMTALVVAKYGTFNQSVLLTNLSYDVALTIRMAQTYGLSVRSSSDSSPLFNSAYGVVLSANPTPVNCVSSTASPQQFILYADTVPNSVCDNSDVAVSTYAIKRGAVISGVCVGTPGSCTFSAGTLDISFKRPDPRATICFNTACGSTYAEIQLKATDGSTRSVAVRNNGQVSVVNY